MQHRCPNLFHRAGTAGFTLVELLIVLVLVAAAATLAVPTTTRAFANWQRRQETVAVASLFRQAKGRALYEGRTYQVVFAPERRQLLLVREDGKQVSRIALSAGVSLWGQRGDGTWTAELEPLRFFPDGTCEAVRFELRRVGTAPVRFELEALAGNVKITRGTEQ